MLLALLSESREPYFDVLIEHGVPAEGPVIDVASKAGYRDGVLWKGGMIAKPRTVLWTGYSIVRFSPAVREISFVPYALPPSSAA